MAEAGPEHSPEHVELPPLPDVEAASAEASQWKDAPMESAQTEVASEPPAEPAHEPAPPPEVWNDPPSEEIPKRVSGAEAADIQAKSGDVDARVIDQAGRPDGLQQAVEDKLDQPLTDGAASDLHVPGSSELVREVRTGSQEDFDADMTRNRERVEGAVHLATDQAQEQMARETNDRQFQEAFDAARKADTAAFEQKQADEASFDEKKAADQKFFDDRKADAEAFDANQTADQAALHRRREEDDASAEKSADEKAALEEQAEQKHAQEEELEAKRRAALETARRNRPRPPGGPGF